MPFSVRNVLCALATLAFTAAAHGEEQPVEPYTMSNANAGARPIEGVEVFNALGGTEGIGRIVDQLVDMSVADPKISEIFVNRDIDRLRRTLREQICYVAGGPCTYTGRTMAAAHADMGVQTRDFNILVEHLRTAMDAERVPNATQNRLLAKLAPMHRDVVAR